MRLGTGQARLRFAAARVASLATVGGTGAPHVVPVTFAVHLDPLHGDHVYSAVDGKPKSTPDLQRLRNIRADPRVTMLADHYDEDWARLWWVRAEGEATILSGAAEMAGPLALLAARYPQYREVPAAGPVISVAVRRWAGWAASPAPAAGR